MFPSLNSTYNPALKIAKASATDIQGKLIACGGGKMGTEPGDAYVAFALPDD